MDAHVLHVPECVGVSGEEFIDKRTLISAHKFDVTFPYRVSHPPTRTVAAARDRHANAVRDKRWSSYSEVEGERIRDQMVFC